MIINDVIIETNYEYVDKAVDFNYSAETPKYNYSLILKVKIPGGEALYKIEIDKDIKESIEQAVKLRK